MVSLRLSEYKTRVGSTKPKAVAHYHPKVALARLVHYMSEAYLGVWGTQVPCVGYNAIMESQDRDGSLQSPSSA
jgi:hypothetical protein